VFIEGAQRRIVVRYAKLQSGHKMFGGEAHLPLKINAAGVIPLIVASSLLLLPFTAAGFVPSSGPDWIDNIVELLAHDRPLYMILYAVLIIFLAFFYAAVAFNPTDTAESLRKYGGFIPTFQPGKTTADYFHRVLTRLTVVGAAYLTFIAILPEILISEYGVPFYFGGASLLIVVTVTMDTVAQLRSPKPSAA
jgi:preprotein translocase subunit SecY